MVFSGPCVAATMLDAVALIFTIGMLIGSVVKLQTWPLKMVESGGRLTSSTRQ